MKQIGYNVGTIHSRNRKLVFNIVASRGPISRASIARFVKLSITAITDIVAELIEIGLVKEAGIGSSSSGRPPNLVELSGDTFCVLGLSMGAEKTCAVLTDPRGNIHDRAICVTKRNSNPHAIIEQLIIDKCR